MGDAMIRIDNEFLSDVAAREALLDRAFGETRFAKTSERLRAGRLPAEGLALAARDRAGRLVGTVRLWNVAAGLGRPALLLGPLAVDEAARGEGVGSALMREALHRAGGLGHRAVPLVGDAPYYGRFGFSAAMVEGLDLPGPVDRARFLGLELVEGALDGARGLVRATGRRPSRIPAGRLPQAHPVPLRAA
jgi:predicted N-acetyltransferase YhbS